MKKDVSILSSDFEGENKGLSCGWSPIFMKTKCWGAMTSKMWQKKAFSILGCHDVINQNVDACSFLL